MFIFAACLRPGEQHHARLAQNLAVSDLDTRDVEHTELAVLVALKPRIE